VGSEEGGRRWGEYADRNAGFCLASKRPAQGRIEPPKAMCATVAFTVAGLSLAPTSFRRKPESGEFVSGASSAEHAYPALEGGCMASETNGEIQAVKAAQNQSLWREVNERILAVAPERVEFICECADLDCGKTLRLSVAEYEHIRSSPVRFPIALGHDVPQVEDVVEENDHYVVVQKRGIAGEVSAKLDPRSRA
jgi:hypothetical protein